MVLQFGSILNYFKSEKSQGIKTYVFVFQSLNLTDKKV